MTAKLLDASRDYWRRRGVTDWGEVRRRSRRLLKEKEQLIRRQKNSKISASPDDKYEKKQE